MMKSKICLILGLMMAVLPLDKVFANDLNKDKEVIDQSIEQNINQVDTLEKYTKTNQNDKLTIKNNKKIPNMNDKYIGKIEVDHNYDLVIPFKEGDKLNMANIDQLIENLKTGLTDPLVLLKPTKDKNIYDVIIKTKRIKEFRGNLAINNDNDDMVYGHNDIYISVSKDHIITYGDTLTLLFREQLSKERYMHTNGLRYINYTMPMGKYKLSVTKYRNFQKNRLEKSKLLSNVYTDNVSINLINTYNRSQKKKLSYSIGTKYNKATTIIGDVYYNKQNNSYTSLNIGWNGIYYGNNSAASINPSVEIFNAGMTKNLNKKYKENYAKLNFNAFYTKNYHIGKNYYDNYTVNISGSYSPYHQVNNRQFIMGGLNSVRGFKNTNAHGDKGFYIKNTFTRNYKHFSPFIGLDFGMTKDYSLPYTDKIGGVSFGLNYKNRNLQGSLTVAKPILFGKAMEYEGKRKEKLPIYFQLNYDF